MRAMPIALCLATMSAMCSIAAAQDDKLRPCEYKSQRLNTLRVVIKVKPVEGTEWKFPEAPEVVARRLLDDLNKNANWIEKDNGIPSKTWIKFEEASGQQPDFIINVVVTETYEGTRQDSLEAAVEGPRNPYWALVPNKPSWKEFVWQLTVKSGDFAFVKLTDAIDALSRNLAYSFRQGWTFKPPCWDHEGIEVGKHWFVRRK
jgi:hypothetical protein